MGVSGPYPMKSRRPSHSSRFLYRTVSQALRERVAGGAYEAGSRIPSVEDLAAEFGVSSITIRRAIRDLSLEGLLIGRQGLGVFVATKRRIVRSITADRILPIEEDIKRAGLEPGIRELDMTLVAAEGEPTLRAFGGASGGFYRIERVLLADGESVGLDTVWLPRRLGDRLKADLRGHFIMPLLEAHKIAIDHVDYRFEAATATDAQAALLDIVTGFPLLVIRFAPIGTEGTPVIAGRTTTRADRFAYEFCGHPRAHAARSLRARA
jgi:DNA-binding GntR family transcriptional regulator